LKKDEAVSIYAISIDSPSDSKVFAERIAADRRGQLTFPLLSDPGHRVIDAYRLRDTSYDGKDFEGIPRPAVYVIDRSGRVAWMKVEEDYRVRPTNADIRAALDGAK
jgi:peroxiredoxin